MSNIEVRNTGSLSKTYRDWRIKSIIILSFLAKMTKKVLYLTADPIDYFDPFGYFNPFGYFDPFG